MQDNIKFNRKVDKIIETILYLAHKLPELDTYKVVKLIYLADIAHLNRHGRPVTFDKIVAMNAGPVASTAYDILKGNMVKGVDRSKLPFKLRTIEPYTYVEEPMREINRKLFSKSDLIILDEIIAKYGDAHPLALYKETHKHFAYRKAWGSRGDSRAPEMLVEDMIEESSEKAETISDLATIAPHI